MCIRDRPCSTGRRVPGPDRCGGYPHLQSALSRVCDRTHGYSDRIGPRARAESIGSSILPAEAISTLSSPYLFLLNYPGPGRIWPGSDVSMSDIYSGSVVVVLALFALLIRSPWRYWLAAVALFFLAASLGNQLPLRGWIYDWIPLTRF